MPHNLKTHEDGFIEALGGLLPESKSGDYEKQHKHFLDTRKADLDTTAEVLLKTFVKQNLIQ